MNRDEHKFWLEAIFCQAPWSGDFPAAGKYGFPQLAQVNCLPEEPVYPFNYLQSKSKDGRYWYHCFTSDKNFHRLYNHFAENVELLRGAKGLISADFSLFRDYPEKALIDNCRKNRLIDYALQQARIPMIPTAGFADESSWKWCFDGLPLNSTVAVTTNCLGRDRETHRLFVGGINAMVKKIHPTAIVVCGKVPASANCRFCSRSLKFIVRVVFRRFAAQFYRCRHDKLSRTRPRNSSALYRRADDVLIPLTPKEYARY